MVVPRWVLCHGGSRIWYDDTEISPAAYVLTLRSQDLLSPSVYFRTTTAPMHRLLDQAVSQSSALLPLVSCFSAHPSFSRSVVSILAGHVGSHQWDSLDASSLSS